MAPIFYRKLVRDKIPSIIRKEGKNPAFSTLPEDQRAYHLRLKLLEEAHELFKAKDSSEFTKEAADVLEVVLALAKHHQVSLQQIEQTRQQRAEGRGAFNEGVYLHAVYGNDEHLPESDRDGAQLNPFVVSTGSSPSLLQLLRQELSESIECCIASAFLTRAVINLLKRPIEEFLERGCPLQIITSTMNSFNNPDDLLHIKKTHPNLQLKVFHPGNGSGPERFLQAPPAFHLKCFLFRKADERNSLIIGSSNMTGGGLLNNEEWNYFSNSEVNLPFNPDDHRSVYEVTLENYRKFWNNDAVEISDEFLEFYRNRFEQARRQRESAKAVIDIPASINAIKPEPRQNQLEALQQLALKRSNGVTRTAVIAATGLGKTHLAAFDFASSGMKNILFVVHRENILTKAREAFREVLGDPHFGELFTGNTAIQDRKQIAGSETSVFAMVQTLSREKVRELFRRDRFEYIVFDEFHHSEAKTYRVILEHFTSKFFLGLTATPERMDGRDVLKLCDYDIAYEARLFSAIEQRWLTPFQYYAIYDSTDYTQIRWTGSGYDEQQLEHALSNDTRAKIIISNLKTYLPATGKIKALAFCANKGHARYMTKAFNSNGIFAECLLGESGEDERTETIFRLQNEADPLQVICSVDILGEGVDIPAVSHVMLLRPTESPAVILQQLGRGLRLLPGKEFLVALDFVGNYKNSYITPLILQGQFFPDPEQCLKGPMKFKLPNGCSVDGDARVMRIWNDDIQKTFEPKRRQKLQQTTYTADFLIDAYGRMKKDLGQSPTLLDFLANPEAADPQALLKVFDNWLKVKKKAEDITEFETGLLDTPAESFLQHFEKELSPTKSYKMVVLKTLLADAQNRTSWPAEWIAQGFKDYYLSHPGHLYDCSIFDANIDHENVPISKFVTLLKTMPLKYLSNKPTDFFIFDQNAGTLSLKPEIESFWKIPKFRDLVSERVDYALALYFHRKQQTSEPETANTKSILTKIENLKPEAILETKTENPEEAEETVELPYFSTLKMAAGFITNTSTADYESEMIHVAQSGNLSPDRHFVVKISGNSMDGGKSPIKDGDLVILERITTTSAGSMTNQIIAVEYQDESGQTAYALKKITKTSTGKYLLKSLNKDFKDVEINPEAIKPIARLTRIQ